MPLTGNDVYKSLMDIHITLSSLEDMLPLKFFLDSITPDNVGLVNLNREIAAFKNRLDTLVFVSKGNKLPA